VPVENGELHEAVEKPQRLVDGDVLLRLCRQQIGSKRWVLVSGMIRTRA
jgi:hypothetical protein